LVVDGVADRASGDGTNETANQGAGRAVSAAAVIADDGTGEGADGAAGDSTLLGVRAGTDASGQDGAEDEGSGISFHGIFVLDFGYTVLFLVFSLMKHMTTRGCLRIQLCL
jgi:hypothetical protein